MCLIHVETPEAKAVVANWNKTVLTDVHQALTEGNVEKASIILWNSVNDPRFSFDAMPAAHQALWLANARLSECLPSGARMAVVPNAPHVWYPINPKAGAETMLAFLAKV
jgi:hypothetical protein